MGARAQQFDSRLIANLDASTGEKRDPPAEVGRLRTLAEVQLRATRAKLIVEMVNLRVVLFADITVLRLHDFTKVCVADYLVLFEAGRRMHIWRGENGLLPKLADAGVVQANLVTLRFLRLTLTHPRFH